MEIDLPSPLGARASLPCKEKSEEKSGEKIEEVRSRPCVCDEGCAGNPGETVKALPGRPGRAGCGLPGAPMLPKAAAPAAPSSCRKEWPAFARLPSCRKSSARITAFPRRRPFAASRSRPPHETRVTAFMAVRFAVGAKGSHHQKPPPGPLYPPTSRGFPAHIRAAMRGNLVAQSLLACPELPGIARQKNIAPEQVSAHRQPFWVGLTASAVRRSSGRLPGCCRCGSRKMNPC